MFNSQNDYTTNVIHNLHVLCVFTSAAHTAVITTQQDIYVFFLILIV